MHYENTDTWSDEVPCTHSHSPKNNIVKQKIQLQTYINAAQHVQWQHQDNTIAQEMLLEELAPVTNYLDKNNYTNIRTYCHIEYRQHEHNAHLYSDTFNIGESYIAGPWHIRHHNQTQFAILDYSNSGCHLCGEYSKVGSDEFIHHDKHTNWQNSIKIRTQMQNTNRVIQMSSIHTQNHYTPHIQTPSNGLQAAFAQVGLEPWHCTKTKNRNKRGKMQLH